MRNDCIACDGFGRIKTCWFRSRQCARCDGTGEEPIPTGARPIPPPPPPRTIREGFGETADSVRRTEIWHARMRGYREGFAAGRAFPTSGDA